MSDSEYIKQAEDVFREAIEITRSIDGWKVEKEDKANNLIVEMKKNAHGRKIYRCKVLLLRGNLQKKKSPFKDII